MTPDYFTGLDLRKRSVTATTLAHANGIKAIAAAKVKTDSADAKMLAHLLRTDLLPEAHMVSDEMRPLRDVLRTRLRLVERRVAEVGPELVARLGVRSPKVRDACRDGEDGVVGECPLTPSVSECVELEIEPLVGSRDAGVADERGGVLRS